MGIPKGTHLDGVRTLADLKMRCHIDEESGCWRWKGHCCRGTPFTHFPLDGKAMKASGRRAALILSGQRPEPGQVAFPRDACMYHDCVRPQCARWGTVSDRMQYVARQGRFGDPERLARLARYNESRRKVSTEDRLEIVLSPETGVEIAKRMNISQRRVSQIRSTNRTTPAASVFEWRG